MLSIGRSQNTTDLISFGVLAPLHGSVYDDLQRLHGIDLFPAFSSDRADWNGSHILMRFGLRFFLLSVTPGRFELFALRCIFLRFFMLLVYTLSQSFLLSSFCGPFHYSINSNLSCIHLSLNISS